MSAVSLGAINFVVHAYLDSNWYQVLLSYFVILTILSWQNIFQSAMYGDYEDAQVDKEPEETEEVARRIREWIWAR